MSLTGPLAGNASALIAMEIWRDDVNAKADPRRKVEFVYYDTRPAPPPSRASIQTPRCGQGHLVVSGYGTNVIRPRADHDAAQSHLHDAVR